MAYISPDNLAILRGQLYKLSKKEVGEHKGNQHENGNRQILPISNTAESIAKLTGVSEKTIRNDAKFAEAVDIHARARVETRSS